ncbi:hypothetical protein Pla110_05600 [Polystyrenella longa]|uniref:Uncharacterized protein n=1 Tax=Polystyrenella longa TaxID=2528007 RepID=A0A518CI07_9PLAN|nr:hypothetical protein [Polystyrenella longa]QDU78856.1 hypothetical protein Pla110_05600 [Polystyrenella longa]
MEISFATLAPVYEALISGEMSREEASDWAIKIDQEWDEGIHTVPPTIDESVLYDAFNILKAADFKNSPTEYFHPLEDFIDHYNEHVKPQLG